MKRKGTTTFPENLQQSGRFGQTLLGLSLRPIGSGETSLLTIGGLNPAHFTSPIRYYKVDDASYWKVRIELIKVLVQTISSRSERLLLICARTGASRYWTRGQR